MTVLLGELSAAPSAHVALSKATLEQHLTAHQQASLQARLLAHGASFLGVRYGFSPLGEGQGPDADPLYRFDELDCLTFVEETMAMALAQSEAEFADVLQAIRYREETSFNGRNHLMEADWLPNNLRKGFLQDVTQLYGPTMAKQGRKVLSASTWKSRSAKRLQLPTEAHRTGTFEFWYVPIDDVSKIIGKVPSGTLMVVVREEKPWTVTQMTHLGWVVHKGAPFLRHASKTFKRVVDERLDLFLDRQRRYEKWKVIGVSFFDIRSPKTIP